MAKILEKLRESISVEKKEKIGQVAKKFFADILQSEKLQSDVIENLQDKMYSKENFGTNFPVLTQKIEENIKVRYYSKPIFGTYYLTNDWYDKNIKKLNTSAYQYNC